MMEKTPLERKRRVLFVAWFLSRERRWLSEHLDPERYECDFVGLPQRVDITKKRTSAFQWLKHFLLAVKARFRMLQGSYDLIVTAFPQVASMVSLVNGLTGNRTPHIAWYFNCGHEYHGLRRWFARITLKSVKRFIVYSRKEQDAYSRMLLIPKRRFLFTYLTGVQLDRRNYTGARSKFGLNEHYIASLGSSGRDFNTLFEAVAGLKVQTVVVSHRQALKGTSPSPSVKVIETIPQGDYLRILADADVCVIPVSNRETASGQMTLIQAMSLGVPVIATRCIGTEDYIIHGETGYLVDMFDVEGLRRALYRLLNHPEERSSMAKKALEFANAHFQDRCGSNVLDAVYSELQRNEELSS